VADVKRMSVVVAFVVLITVSAATAAARAPSLKVLTRSPLLVAGQSFAPGERVTVTALTGLGPRIAHTTARSGHFRARFPLPSSGCAAAFGVRAVGSAGSRVTTIFAKATNCLPPPRD
jgi:hypothetical protein